MPEQAPAGWYPAPHADNQPRYWDGTRWHEAAPPAPPVQPAYVQAPAASSTTEASARAARPRSGGPALLALFALILGILAFLTGLVPGLGLILAIAAVGLAVFALVRKQPKGLAVTGLALGSIALLTGIVSTAVSAGSSDSVTAETSAVEPAEPAPAAAETEEAQAAEAPAEAAPVEEAPAAEAAPAEAAAPAAGTAAAPMAQPYTAKGLFGGDKYSLTARIVDANAGGLVAEWNMFNSEAPAGFKYVVAELTMTGIDPDGVEPSLAGFDLSLATPEGNRYDNEYVTLGEGMSSMSDGPTLYPGSTFTGYTTYVVPESAQSFLLFDNGKYISF